MIGGGDESNSKGSKSADGAQLTESASGAAEIQSLRAELEEVIRENLERRQAIRALDREVVQLRAMLAEAERQMGNIRQTFIYRIGEIIVSARTWQGVRQLPRKLIALRRAFLEKRGLLTVPGVARVSLAERLRHADEAIGVLEAQGIDTAVAYVRGLSGRDASDRARAFLELAHAVYRTDPARAASLAAEAGNVDPNDPRLRSLVLSLFDHGAVDAPALILSTVADALTSTPVDRARRETILAQERQLASPLRFPSRVSLPLGRMRVAVVASRAQPHHTDAETFRAEAVIEAVHEVGLEAWLVTPPGYQYPAAGDGQPAHRTFGSHNIVRMPPIGLAPGVFDKYIPLAGSALSRELIRLGVTHVHAIGDTGWAATACWAAMETGATFTLDVGAIPSFGSHVDDIWINTQRFRSGMSLLTEIFRVSDAVIVRSKAIDGALRQFNINFDTTIVPDGIPSDLNRVSDAEADDFRNGLGLADQEIIGVFESLDLDEGLFDLIEALPSIRDVQPNAVIFLAGGGPGAEAIRQRAAVLGVSDFVLFATDAQRRRIPDLLSIFTVAVFPKKRQWLPGLAAPFELQAVLAVGVPAVVAASPWSLEWIDNGMTGLVFEPGDADALAKAVVSLLRDPLEATRLGAAGRERVRERAGRSIVQPTISALFQIQDRRA